MHDPFKNFPFQVKPLEMHVIIYFIPDAIYFYQDALRITAYNEHRRVWIAKFFHRWALFFVLLAKFCVASDFMYLLKPFWKRLKYCAVKYWMITWDYLRMITEQNQSFSSKVSLANVHLSVTFSKLTLETPEQGVKYVQS